MKKILVPCDFSDTAKEAFKFAVSIATKNDADIHVLYVIDNSFIGNATAELSHLAAFNTSFMQRMEEQLNEKFIEIKNTYAPPNISITFKLVIGILIPSIETYIRNKNIDLVVMGTHGASGLKELLIGSNTEKIVRISNVPVVAVPLGSPFGTITDIVFPAAPDPHADNFIHALKSVQNFFDAKLKILWVNTPHIFKSDTEAKEDLQDFADHYQLQNYTLNIRNEYSEQEGILRFAKEINASLIFMPTHSRKGLTHWLTGSITENVVNHVQCPVWTYSIKSKG